jgi:hypothetical protein
MHAPNFLVLQYIVYAHTHAGCDKKVWSSVSPADEYEIVSQARQDLA